MLGQISYPAQCALLRKGVDDFQASLKGAEDFLALALALRNGWPEYRIVGGHQYGVHQSDFLRILRESGVPGDYDTLIASAES